MSDRLVSALLDQIDRLRLSNGDTEKAELEKKVKELEKTVKKQQGYIRSCCKAGNMGTPGFIKGEPCFAFLALREHPYATW